MVLAGLDHCVSLRPLLCTVLDRLTGFVGRSDKTLGDGKLLLNSRVRMTSNALIR